MQEFIALISGNTHAPATAAGIAEFEKEIGNKLPDDYREFLMKCGGGYAKENAHFNWSGGDCGGVLDTIGGMRDEDPDYSICSEWREGRWPLPKGFLWIMTDTGGNAISLALSGDEVGQVYFLDHELMPDRDDDERDDTLTDAVEVGYAIFLAPSFSAFIDGLHTSSSCKWSEK